MADYRDHYEQIRSAGASVAAISVDAPEISEKLRRDLGLPFPILCDANRRLIQAWEMFNSRERGGIAKPGIFVIDRGRTVRYAGVDSMAKRVPAGEVIRILQSTGVQQEVRRKTYLPRWGDWSRAFANLKRPRR